MAKISNKNYRITFKVTRKDKNDELEKYIKELKRKTSGNKKLKTKKNVKPVTDKMILDLERLSKSVNFNRGSNIDKIVRNRGQNIENNIQSRIEQNFSSNFRLISATNDERYSAVEYTGNSISFGIASVEVLDEYTTIFIQDPTEPGINGKQEQRFYEPPGGGYGNIDGWWRLQEYIGSHGKDEFASSKTFWWVAMHSHTNNRSNKEYTTWGGFRNSTGGYKPKPFIVKDRSKDNSILFEEDASEIVAIIPEIAKDILRRAKIDIFGK